MAEATKVQSTERIFQILETLGDNGPMGLMDLSKYIGLHKSTTHRLVNSLVTMGYAVKNKESGKYQLTFKLVGIAGKILGDMDIVNVARPYINQLVTKSRETVHLVQRDDNNIIYIDKIESHANSIRMVSRVGLQKPMICTAVGKAILATLSEIEVRDIWKISEIKKYTQYTITDYNEFLAELESIRKKGYALDNEENEIGVRCIGACILDYKGNAYNAFSISAPTSRMDDIRIKELSQYVLETKYDLSKELGYQGS